MKAVSTFSLLICSLGLAHGLPYSKLEQAAEEARTADQKLILIKDRSDDKDLRDVAEQGLATVDEKDKAEAVNNAMRILHLKSIIEDRSSAISNQPLAHEIKSSPLYRDPGVQQQSNWLGAALERLRKLRFPEQQVRSAGPNFAFGSFFIYALWGLLGIAVLTFLALCLRFLKLKSANRRPTTIIDEDEPDRTHDEWLALSDRYEAEGRYRDAIRALYLACLLKFDEAKVARFDRGQTNWEHLRRIEASKFRPEGLEFRKPTQEFDQFWYGSKTSNRNDVEAFRSRYSEVVQLLRGVDQ